MNSMLAAIKKRKSGQAPEPNEAPTHDTKGGGKDLHGLVASLSDHEKESLKVILDQGTSDDAMAIQKGQPSKEEHQKIAEASAKEDARTQAEQTEDTNQGVEAMPSQLPEDESDEIAKSMLDSRHMRGMATEKPRNLGDRMKQSLASKLKSKGKI